MKKAEIKIRLTQEQKDSYQASADKAGLSLSDYIRAAVEAYCVPTPNAKEEKKLPVFPQRRR